MRKFLLSLFVLAGLESNAQYKVHVEDVELFWKMYDKLIAVTDSAEQIKLIQTEYLDKGSDGLKEFNSVRDGNAVNYFRFIRKAKDRLEKIRPYTLSVLQQKLILDKKLERFKQLYPNFKRGDVYFTIGIGNSGGTTQGSHVLIGCEVAASSAPDWAIGLVLHEFVHTQQNQDTTYNLLSQTIMEGAAEFIMEIVNEKNIAEGNPRGYIGFGLMNEKEVWQKFKEVMFASDNDNTFGWMYGAPGVEIAGINKVDMAYYMGYRICKSYYDNAADKAKAISDIIDLKYDREAARLFILKSGYVPKEDTDFVKYTAFRKQPAEDKVLIKRNYGVTVGKNEIIFEYKAPGQLLHGYIDSVMVAGNFNNWNPANAQYKMKEAGKGKYQLRLPIAEFRKNEEYTFKFVINGNEWLLAPKYAVNVDKSGNNNLVFIIK